MQIAGLIARRIVPFVQEGQTVSAGDRIGMIRFGSRVDVYLPEGTRPLVAEGQTVAGRRNRDRRSGRARTRAAASGSADASQAIGLTPGSVRRNVAGTVKTRYIDRMRSPFDPERIEARREARRQRFRAIPVRTLLPNMITLMALCAGLTGIRLAFEGKMEMALGAIVFAAALDGIDGRVARMIKGQSKFGAELDSLADFMNFGCAPALFLYLWGLHDLGNGGWIAAMVFAICGALRLARFNVMIDDPNKPAWAGNFFTGVPAPAGALVVLLPIYLNLLDLFKAPRDR